MAKKEVTAQVKLQIPAGKANPAPPVGPAFGRGAPLKLRAAERRGAGGAAHRTPQCRAAGA